MTPYTTAHTLQSLKPDIASSPIVPAANLRDNPQAAQVLPNRILAAGSRFDYRPRRGLSIPSVTILDREGRIIEDEQRRVFRFNAQSGRGADVIFAAGTTGEWNRISNHERQRLTEIEVDEVHRINERTVTLGLAPVEAWAGATAESRAQTIDNLRFAIEAGADAAVIAPLSIRDIIDPVSFFQRDVSDLFDHLGKWLPVYLYDNADIAANPKIPHIRTRDVKRLSRLSFIYGVKVSAPSRVLGNYTKGALHYRDKGEFGIYVGDAMLIFQVFRMDDGPLGKIREYWNRYLLHNELPIGVVSGPANVLPREWQRAWRACYAADIHLMSIYGNAFSQFSQACCFGSGIGSDKTIACLKHALAIEGVIETVNVAKLTPDLTETEAQTFASRYARIRDELAQLTDPVWISRKEC